MIPTDEPGQGGFITREQWDAETEAMRLRGQPRQERAQRFRQDMGGMIQNPLGYAANAGVQFFGNLSSQPVGRANVGQALMQSAPAAMQTAQGATMGFGDEIVGGLSAAGAALTGGDSGQAYRQNTDAVRAEMAANRQAAPLSTFGAEALGGAATGNVGSGFVRNASTRLGMAGRTAAVGAGYGAVTGTGEADGGVGQRAVGGAIGGTLGGVLGAGAPLTLEGGVRVGRAGLRLLDRAINSRGAGREMTRNQRRALNQLISEAEGAGRPPAEILRRIDELREAGASAEQTVAELLGEPGINRAAGGVLTGNADALQGRARVNQRQAQQPARVRGYLQEGIGATGSEFPTARAELDVPNPRETELYTAFRDQPGIPRQGSGAASQRQNASSLADQIKSDLGLRAFDVSESNGIITVNRIVVPEGERGGGLGTDAMNRLMRYADETGQTVALTPSGDFGGSVPRLRRFYEGFGFQNNKGSNRVYETRESMVAFPRTGASSAGAAPSQTERINEFFDNPRFARIANEAAQDVMDSTGQRVNIEAGEVSPEVFDAIKRRMDRLISDAEGGAQRNTAASRPLRALRSRFLAFADEVFPNYAPARAEGQLRLSAREALIEGRQIFRTENVRNPEEIAARVAQMTPEQLRRFRQGVARGVVDQMNTAPRNVIEAGGQVVESGSRDAANPILRFWNRADRQEALRAAFGNEETFLRFVRRINIEGDRAADFRRMSPTTQGSPTQRNAIATGLSDGTRMVADLGEAASGNPIGPILRRITEFASGDRTPAQIEREIQRILWASPEDIAPQLLSVLERRGVITAAQAASLENARMLAAPATNALIQSTQN
jgi:GNAT superfamily N-acetyltransferase